VRAFVLLALLTSALVLAACGGDDGPEIPTDILAARDAADAFFAQSYPLCARPDGASWSHGKASQAPAGAYDFEAKDGDSKWTASVAPPEGGLSRVVIFATHVPFQVVADVDAEGNVSEVTTFGQPREACRQASPAPAAP